MNIFNEDLSTIREKIYSMSDIFARAETKEDYYKAYISYKTLCDIYKELSKKEIYDLSGSKKIVSYLITDSYRKEFLDEFYRDFYMNRNLSKEMFKDAIVYGERMYNASLMANQNRKNIPDSLKTMESIAIIYSFLEEKFPESLKLFKEIMQNKKIYLSKSENIKKDTYYYYDIYNDDANMFLTNSLENVSDMVDFINQFGHIVDCQNMAINYDEGLALPVSNTLRFDSKYVSSYYKLEFIKYLIENNLYKKDAQIELSKMMNRSFKYLKDGYLVSLADEQLYHKLKYGNVTKYEFINEISKTSKEEIFSVWQGANKNYPIRLPKISSTSYGICMAMLTDDKRKFINFIKDSNKDSNFQNKLENHDIKPEEIGKRMVKTLELL